MAQSRRPCVVARLATGLTVVLSLGFQQPETPPLPAKVPPGAPIIIVLPVHPLAPAGALSQGGATPAPAADERALKQAAIAEMYARMEAEIKPAPPFEIPDNPPPHEGAMIDYPLVIQPPDIIQIDVLEALPGRPITGERLVRPDGTVSLDFYGNVYVRGLTPRQAKEKIILHLRKFLNDEVLGLEQTLNPEESNDDSSEAMPPQPDFAPPALPSPGETFPEDRVGKPSAMRGNKTPRIRRTAQARMPEAPMPLPAPADERTKTPAAPTSAAPYTVNLGNGMSITFQVHPTDSRAGSPEMSSPSEPSEPPAVRIRPADSERVYVDITAFNHDVYFVQGDVTAPGRLPFTGHETVLDALNYAGGLAPTAEPKDIKLIRPSRGGQPARVYKIDLDAILEKGDSRANLQIFPGDRLVIGRHPTVKATVAIDRLMQPLNAIAQYQRVHGSAMRASARALGQKSLTPEQREAFIDRTVKYWWPKLQQGEERLLDEETLREGLRMGLPPANRPSSEGSQSPAQQDESNEQ